MNKSTIPTFLGLLILLSSIISGVVIIKGVQIFKSSANSGFIPQDVQITNVKDTSFTVSFLTDTPTINFVKYSSSSGSFQTPPTNLSRVHFITVQNLTPSTTYSFQINSGGENFDNFDGSHQALTLPSYIPSEKVISGKILDRNNLPVKNVLVYVANSGVRTNSAVTSMSGSWIISLAPLSDTVILQIRATDGNGESNAQIDLKSANPTPDMVLGKTYDFRNQDIKQTIDVPSVQINLPEK